jgi:hypothetical protein
MTVNDLLRLPGARLLETSDPDALLLDAYTSDLLSDVIAHAPDGSVLITIQAHANTVAVATLAGIRAILVCRDRPIPPDMREAAKKEHVAVVTAPVSQYEASWRIHALLNPVSP